MLLYIQYAKAFKKLRVQTLFTRSISFRSSNPNLPFSYSMLTQYAHTVCSYSMVCRICIGIVRVQPRKPVVVDHPDHMPPARKDELDDEDHTDHTDHRSGSY